MKIKKRVSQILVFAILLSTLMSGFAFAATADMVRADDVAIKATAHIQKDADVSYPEANGYIQFGTTGEAKRLENFTLTFKGLPEDMRVQYMAHVQKNGDMPWVTAPAVIGTAGEAKRMEGIAIRLVDKDGKPYPGYSVRYQVHMQTFGWGISDTVRGEDKWAYDGDFAGSRGFAKRVEAIKVEILKDAELKVLGVSAINSTQAEVKFNKAVKEVKPANFKVTDKDGNLVFVSKVELSSDKKTATLTFFGKFADKMTYTVETTAIADSDGKVMEKDTDAFTYLAADVAKIEFKSVTIPRNKELVDYVKVTDALGRDVTKEVTIEYESSNTDIVNPSSKKTGTTDGLSIVVAKVKVGDTWIKTAPTIIKVSDNAAATFVGYNVYTGTNPAGTTTDFEKLSADKKADFVYMGSTANLALYYKDQYGNSMNALTSGFTVVNLTPSIVIVNSTDGKITPVSVGDGYIKVTNGTVEATIKIVVRATSVINTMELDKSVVSVVAGKMPETVKVTFKDQYGTKVNAVPTVTLAQTPTVIATAVAGQNSIVISGITEGSTTVDVTYKVGDSTLKQTIYVVVVKAGDLATYKAEIGATKIDVDGVNNDPNKLPVSTDVTVYEIDTNGNKLGTINPTLEEVDKNGNTITDVAKQLVTISGKTVTAKAAGTAYVRVKVGSLAIDTLTIEVVKTAPAVKTAEVESLTLSKKFTEVATTALEDVIKNNIILKDQYGNKMKTDDVVTRPDTVDYKLTNADGLTVTDKQITAIAKDKALVDIVLTEAKVTGNNKNLLAAPVVIKLQVNYETAVNGKFERAQFTRKSANQTDVNNLMEQLDTAGVFAKTAGTLTIDSSKVTSEMTEKTKAWWGSTLVPVVFDVDSLTLEDNIAKIVINGRDGKGDELCLQANWNRGRKYLVWFDLANLVKGETNYTVYLKDGNAVSYKVVVK